MTTPSRAPATAPQRYASVRAGLVYFLLVFGAGFVLGPIRMTWLVPRLGERWAELAELPVMWLVIAVAGRWTVARWRVPAGPHSRLGMGLLALFCMLVAELALVWWLRGLTLAQYCRERDPVSGAAYYASLLYFAAWPWWLGKLTRARG